MCFCERVNVGGYGLWRGREMALVIHYLYKRWLCGWAVGVCVMCVGVCLLLPVEVEGSLRGEVGGTVGLPICSDSLFCFLSPAQRRHTHFTSASTQPWHLMWNNVFSLNKTQKTMQPVWIFLYWFKWEGFSFLAVIPLEKWTFLKLH